MGSELDTLKSKIEENQISLEYDLAENQKWASGEVEGKAQRGNWSVKRGDD